jgi:hypothetical protein
MSLGSDEVTQLREYISSVTKLEAIYRDLGEALETPKIITYAERAQTRVQDATAVITLLEVLPGLEKQLEAAPSDEATTLPAYATLKELEKTLEKAYGRMLTQDSNSSYIDWDLESYLGSRAPIARELQTLASEINIEDLNLDRLIPDFLDEL